MKTAIPLSGGIKQGDLLGGRYRILRWLGSGGSSTVYLAEDLKLNGKLWAVKEIRLSEDRRMGDADWQAWERALQSEAELMGKLSHPALPGIADCFQDELARYVVMEYIDGMTLQQWFDHQGRRIRTEAAVHIAVQLCEVLGYLHSQQPDPIIYRDLKPANLMLDRMERIRLIDFGIARRFKPGRATDTVCIGTPGFAAPEQLTGRQSDARTDLYSLGAMLYYLLSGGKHYYAPDGLRELSSQPQALVGMIGRLTQADPAKRFASAGEVEAYLRLYVMHTASDKDDSRPAPAVRDKHIGGKESPDMPGIAPDYGLRAGRPIVIAVGALYAGAGATFAVTALARQLHERGIPHAVIEPPGSRAELYALLHGDRRAPAGYICYDMWSGGLAGTPRWIDGRTLWLPATPTDMDRLALEQPDPVREKKQLAHIMRSIHRPVWLVDAGCRWDEAELQDWLEDATELICIIDPVAYKLELPASKRNWQAIRRHAALAKPVHLWANKCTRDTRLSMWVKLLPASPSCMLPAISYDRIIGAVWDGVLPCETPYIARQLTASMKSWLDRQLAGWSPRLQAFRQRTGGADK